MLFRGINSGDHFNEVHDWSTIGSMLDTGFYKATFPIGVTFGLFDIGCRRH
jgi:hypothetical protein